MDVRAWPADALLTDEAREAVSQHRANSGRNGPLDLLVLDGDEFNIATFKQFALASNGAERAVFHPAEGLFVSRVTAAASGMFCRARGPQDDQSVYDEAVGTRRRFEREGNRVPAPRQVYLGLTQRCDRDCTFCVSRSFDFDLLSLDEVNRLADHLDGDVDVIALTGTGEAMTHPQFWEAFDLLCERFPRARYKMNTSGLSLVRHSERLLGYPIKNITVSLNATTEETYRRFVGKGLAAVIRGIERLVETRAALDRHDVRICLSMVLMNTTARELSDMVGLAHELGVEEIQGITLMLNDESLLSESTWYEQERTNEQLTRARQRGERLGVQVSLPPLYGGHTGPAPVDQGSSLPVTQGHRCTEVFSTTYLRPNGDISPCPYFDETFGNTRETPFDEIWNGARYTDLRHRLATGDLLPQCRHCCGFSEGGSVDDRESHWLGIRGHRTPLPIVAVTG